MSSAGGLFLFDNHVTLRGDLIQGNLCNHYGAGMRTEYTTLVLVDTAVYPHLSFGFCGAGTDRAYYALNPLGNLRPCKHTPTILQSPDDDLRRSDHPASHSRVYRGGPLFLRLLRVAGCLPGWLQGRCTGL